MLLIVLAFLAGLRMQGIQEEAAKIETARLLAEEQMVEVCVSVSTWARVMTEKDERERVIRQRERGKEHSEANPRIRRHT